MGSAVCSAAETALFSLTQADRLRLRKTAPSTNQAVNKLLASPRALIIAILLGNVSVNSAYFVAASMVGAALFGPLGLTVFSIASLLTIILFGEVLPKSIAVVHRVWLCRLVAVPLLWWFTLVKPIRSFAERFLIAPTVRVLTPPSAQQAQTLGADELAAILEAGGREGVLASDEQRLLGDVIRLSSVRVRDVMAPRVDVKWLDAAARVHDVLELTKETNFAKFPVCRGELTAGALLGFIGVRQLLPLLNKDPKAHEKPLTNLLDPIRFVPERAKLDQLLEHFRATKSDTAMCVNEAGEVTGFVQLDAVISELVGVGVAGEAAAGEELQVRMIGMGQWEVPGRLGVRDWAEFFGERSVAADPRVSTVSGVIIAKLGRLPKVGDSVRLGDLNLRVESMNGRVVNRVVVSLASKPPADMKEGAKAA